jgi:hypothetical protein
MQKPSCRLHFGQRIHVVLKCTAGFLGRLTVALVIGGGASWRAAVVLGAERNIKTSEYQTLLRVRAWIARDYSESEPTLYLHANLRIWAPQFLLSHVQPSSFNPPISRFLSVSRQLDNSRRLMTHQYEPLAYPDSEVRLAILEPGAYDDEICFSFQKRASNVGSNHILKEVILLV